MLRRPERLLVREVAAFSIACRHSSHYDSLGLTPKATQNDIKSAYYKLSMQHHPDKSSDETSARKFRAIAEAYEVLGNIKLKKLYDKGLMGGSVHGAPTPEPEPTDPQLKFYRRHSERQVAPTPEGSTPIYNFDAWTKQHYSTILNQSNLANKRIKIRRVKEFRYNNANKQESYFYAVCTLFIVFVALVVQATPDYDIVVPVDNVSDDSTPNKLDKID